MSQAREAGAESVGIVGAGQLAQMLVEAAARLALGQVEVWDESGAPASPAALAGARVTASAAEFFARARTVAFENEFVDCDRLAREGAAHAARFMPELAVIRRLQDKLAQKCALQELGIATSRFERFLGSDVDLSELVPGRFPRGAVLKWARLGYDGKGVAVLRPGDDPARARELCAQARSRGIEVFAEEWVDFRRELAIVACRTADGRFAAYPMVESEQRNGICLWVRGPAEDARSAEAAQLARRFGEGVGIVGAFALELFETRAGKLLVNEIAPRVHNTGHYTQDAADTSQFENHWRAILGRELGSTKSAPAFAMLNLLGPADLALDLEPTWRPERGGGNLSVHWYGKTAVRPGRKLGHVNARANTPGELPALVSELEAWHARWEAGLRARGGKG